MKHEEVLLQAKAVLREAERQGFTNTAAAMREVIKGFQQVGTQKELKNVNQMEAAVAETVCS